MRPFVEADIPQVADLHRRVFRAAIGDDPLPTAYRRYFSAVFLNGASARCGPSSLVYERDGRILGFLGVMPRRMVFNGRPVLMAVCSQFAVDPAGRGPVGLQLLKECFAGPQDLTISDEAGDNTRKIWHWCGGETVVPYSMGWIRPLRPAQFGIATLLARGWLPRLARIASPLGRIADALTARLVAGPFRISPPDGSREELDIVTFLACVRDTGRGSSFHPWYDARLAGWAIERAGQRPGYSGLRTVLVRDRQENITGWFVYAIGDAGTAEVLQISAAADTADLVLEHLFADAMEYGAIAVSGRLDPALIPALAAKRALFYRGAHWMLLHSRNAELRHALHRGDAFLTRLEGEWCLRFP